MHTQTHTHTLSHRGARTVPHIVGANAERTQLLLVKCAPRALYP